MHSNHCDGLPVSYPASDSTGSNPRRNCTTQSPESSGDYSNLDDFYGPSRALQQVAETSQPPHSAALHQTAHHHQQQPQYHHHHHHHHNHLPPAINTATQTYTLPPQIRSAVSTSSSSQGMWPTPPATACEDFDDYTCQDSPTATTAAAAAASGVAPFASFSTRSSATSPTSWPSPDSQQLAFHQSVWKTQHEILPVYDIGICTANMPIEDRFHQQMTLSPYANPNFFSTSNSSSSHHNTSTGSIVDPDSFMTAEAPGMTPDMADSAMSDRSPSPQLKHEFSGGIGYPFEEEEVPPQSGGVKSEAEQEVDEANKVEEPYAQLIYRAFMGRERHAMTLQEIYQWFRDNTDKTNTENKGWQNSIRHNLSMNKVSLMISLQWPIYL